MGSSSTASPPQNEGAADSAAPSSSTAPAQSTSNPQTQLSSQSQASRSGDASSNAPSPLPEQKQQQTEGKRIKITPAASSSPAQSQNVTPVSNTPPPQPRAEESIEAFEDRTLGAVFKITLREDRQKDIHGQKLIYLPGVRSEFQDQGREPRIETGILDQALLEAASNVSLQRPLDYLLPCWKRITRLHKGFRRQRDDDPKFNVISEARRLCTSYCIFAITMPEMFGYVCYSFFSSKWLHTDTTGQDTNRRSRH